MIRRDGKCQFVGLSPIKELAFCATALHRFHRIKCRVWDEQVLDPAVACQDVNAEAVLQLPNLGVLAHIPANAVWLDFDGLRHCHSLCGCQLK